MTHPLRGVLELGVGDVIGGRQAGVVALAGGALAGDDHPPAGRRPLARRYSHDGAGVGDLAGLQSGVLAVAGRGLERLSAGLADGDRRELILDAGDGLRSPVHVEVGVALQRCLRSRSARARSRGVLGCLRGIRDRAAALRGGVGVGLGRRGRRRARRRRGAGRYWVLAAVGVGQPAAGQDQRDGRGRRGGGGGSGASEPCRVSLDEPAIAGGLVAGVLGGDDRGGLPAWPTAGAVGWTGAYQAVSSTIPATSTNAWALLA